MHYPDLVLPNVVASLTAPGLRSLHEGAPFDVVLKESTLAAYMAGRGLAPDHAASLARMWLSPRPSAAPASPKGGVSPRLIERFMQDQVTAALFYRELRDLAPEKRMKDYIGHAMADEEKHYRMLGALYKVLTGKTYEATPKQVTYADLADGLKQAMDDEYEAFEEYRDVYLNAADRSIRNLFFELMTDELEHATRFAHVFHLL